MQARRWDVFCRVIDNFGDIGVCWRLAAALGARGEQVRLWLDDASALTWMAPAGAPGVTVQPWTAEPPALAPGEVVVEAFGCAPPDSFVATMAQQAANGRPPLWINLEYLSAEPYVERSHGLRSPQFSGPGAGLHKWFFYPGFSPSTGGLLHDRSALADDPAGARAWLLTQPWAAGLPADTRLLLLFGYPSPVWPALLPLLAPPGTVMLVPPGGLQQQLQAGTLPTGSRLLAFPHLPQPNFDRLLAATDFNLVRGEDSFVRAQLCSAQPFAWQIYPQQDGAHGPKLEAFLARYLSGSPEPLAHDIRQLLRAVNGLAPPPARAPDINAWQPLHQRWRRQLLAQHDLCGTLLRFVADKQA
jgi:uncharacterized repeat protein (TIGR03837 family)